MKLTYNRDGDILLVETSSEKIDYAEESGPLIVHFSKDNKPVLLEILDASEFLSSITRLAMQVKSEKAVEFAG
ncbi:MAG: DUF2283 domain-containing protein [Ignavibacteriales bacterium]|nr:DUF2283 domain-containing protein [Ignavibacteriales bacterium]